MSVPVSRLAGRARGLGVGRPERDHVIGIEGEVPLGFRLDKPCKLHDRPPSSVDDDPFDLLGVSLDAVTLSGDEG